MAKFNVAENIEKVLKSLTLKNEDKISAVLKNLAAEDADSLKAALKVIQSMGDKVNPALAQELMALIDMAAQPDAAVEQAAKEYPAMKARAEAAETEVKTLKAQATPVDTKDGFPITKEGGLDEARVPAETRAMVKALWESNKSREAELSKIRKDLDTARDERVTKEYIETAGQFSKLPIAKEALGKILKDIALANADAYKGLEQVLKAANEIVLKADPTSELGSNHSRGTGGGGSYEAAIEAPAMAQPIAKEKGMSKDEAVTHFITKTAEGRKAYSQYRMDVESK